MATIEPDQKTNKNATEPFIYHLEESIFKTVYEKLSKTTEKYPSLQLQLNPSRTVKMQ